ncbi:MAG: hypothetical protein JNK91_08320 [Ferruginibacter sp.]|nr:hypothetical protein [Ferruginibacter sp.]
MEKQILQELKDLNLALAKVVGTADLPSEKRFSIEALNKAAKEFQKFSVERGEWVSDSDISKYLKKANYWSGKFIRLEFGFTNFFKRGQTYFYNKKDLIELNKELTARNIDLGRYMEFKEDQEKFKKYVAAATDVTQVNNKKKKYKIPEYLKDIATSSAKTPDSEIIKEDINRLKEEFFGENISDYVDIYKDSHAMLKQIYWFKKYLAPGLKKRCKKWCEDFNYANHALELVTKKNEQFILAKDNHMI